MTALVKCTQQLMHKGFPANNVTRVRVKIFIFKTFVVFKINF